ncbi:MAG: L-2-amino-thiazoline-4-carboxylic acid hydrolase [Solobacterium sp.]|nr:L-2-amino-thiazoline-4-carboxylic acid hydrolase [Solobacterium sp.]
MQRLIRSTCAIAAEEIGKERARHAAEKAQKRYEALCLENASDSKALRAHTYKRIYPSIAVYEALKEEGVDQEKAVWYVREYFQRAAAVYAPYLQRVIRVFGLAKKIPGIFMKVALKSFGPDAGFLYEFPESSENEARANVVRCPYFETCRRYGCPEITRAFCDGDDA